MKHRCAKLRWTALLGGLAVSAQIAGSAQGATRLPVTNAMVVQALRVRGVEVNTANVHLPMQLYVAGPSATLVVVDVDRTSDRRLRVRLRCTRVAECIAFTATLDVEEPAAEAILSFRTNGLPVRREKISPGTAAVVLHAGDHLALSLQQTHLMLQIPCFAVDTGAVGETIRVSTLDHHKTFRAMVTGPATASGVAE